MHAVDYPINSIMDHDGKLGGGGVGGRTYILRLTTILISCFVLIYAALVLLKIACLITLHDCNLCTVG